MGLRELPGPSWLKLLAMPPLIMTWKWFYYSPNTYKELKLARWRKAGRPIPEGVNPTDAITVRSLVFFLFPLPLLALGEYWGTGNAMYVAAIKNLFLAELLTNAHGFLAVVTNHAGEDMYRFRDGCRPYSGSFYLRQILSSTNFRTGSDLNDFLHGYLNYQIEHHLWPNLSMLSYQ